MIPATPLANAEIPSYVSALTSFNMQTIRATIDHGEILLHEPLPDNTGRFHALIVIDDGSSASPGFPVQKMAHKDFQSEEEFEAIGLRDFFGDPVDEHVNWETYFTTNP